MQEASEARLRELWTDVERRWDSLPAKLDVPWAEARFKLETFRITLRQVNESVSILLGGPP
ncbi:hypothetical protein LCGC14_0816690 [marine sediment metagenome]|uniref:Uncharacterized protein n=1 Tax=marine sediment metagenome TaxID=412755 RepID=A0A0F9Q5G4_9ZZZZ